MSKKEATGPLIADCLACKMNEELADEIVDIYPNLPSNGPNAIEYLDELIEAATEYSYPEEFLEHMKSHAAELEALRKPDVTAAIMPKDIPGGMLELFKDITKRVGKYSDAIPFEDYARICSFVANSFKLNVADATTAVHNVMEELGLSVGPSQQTEEWNGMKQVVPFGMQDPGMLYQPLSQKEVKLLKVAELKIADCLACKMNEKEVNEVIEELRLLQKDVDFKGTPIKDILYEMEDFYSGESDEAVTQTIDHLLKTHVAELSAIASYNKVNLIKTARTFAEGEKVLMLREDNKNSTKGRVLKVNKDATYDVMTFSGEVYQNIDPSKLHEPSAEGGRIGGENYGYFDSPRILSDHDVINDNPSAYADAKGQEGQTISDVPNPSLNE